MTLFRRNIDSVLSTLNKTLTQLEGLVQQEEVRILRQMDKINARALKEKKIREARALAENKAIIKATAKIATAKATVDRAAVVRDNIGKLLGEDAYTKA